MTPDALRALAERVEAGDWPGGINGLARQVFPYHEEASKDHGCLAAVAFDGSLDACAALHEAVLGKRWCVASLYHRAAGTEGWYASLCPAGTYPIPDDAPFAVCREAPTPARAWLAAILRARAAEMEAEG